MEKQRTDSQTDEKSNTETMQCPFCCETIPIESTECRTCGSDIVFFNPAALGWITVAEYAAATSTSEEEVMSAVCHGDLDGELICGTWLVLHE